MCVGAQVEPRSGQMDSETGRQREDNLRLLHVTLSGEKKKKESVSNAREEREWKARCTGRLNGKVLQAVL